jgi:sugar lactone lactonase YvrE
LFCSSFASADFTVTPVTAPVEHGEGPHWDAETGVLFFVDIIQELVNKYNPATKQVTHAQLGESLHKHKLNSCKFIVNNMGMVYTAIAAIQ